MGTNGTDILLLVNTGTPSVPSYEAVGSQRGLTIDEETETIDMSSKNSRATRVEPGRYASSLSLDSLYVWSDTGYQALKDAMRDGTKILVAKQEDGVTYETASAVVTSMSEEYPDQEEATISVDLEIDGFWTELVS
jgi:TP901-1 family phage major tail protein